jgi:AraC family transcriptional activator of mtrCDE
MSQIDWLSQLLQMITVTGRPEVRCAYGAPWRVASGASAAHEIPYHVVLKGRAIIEDRATETAMELVAGDIVLLPHGSAHVLHDGSGQAPGPTCEREGAAGLTLSENDGQGERLDMLCGRFFIGPPHDRLIRNYLPTNLVVQTSIGDGETRSASTSNHLASFVELMREESTGDKVGGHAIINALSSALFTLVLRDLAALCSMSRATFMRHFQDTLGRSAIDFLTDIRMGLAANELKKPAMTTDAVAESVGYQSVSSFRRLFADRTGMTPGQWRRLAHHDR